MGVRGPAEVQAGQVPQTKAEYATNVLRRMLQTGSLPPGARVNVGELARKLGISPTPVREAVRQLQAEGILSQTPHRSARVALLASSDPNDLKDRYRILGALEGLAAEIAAENITPRELAQVRRVHEKMVAAVQAGETGKLRALNDQFHLAVNQAARSERLSRLFQSIWRGVPVDTYFAIPERGLLSVREHQVVLDAMEKGSPAEAGAAMRAHLQSSLALLLSHISQLASGSSLQAK